MGAGQSTQPAAAPTPPPVLTAAAPPQDAKAESASNSGGGMASLLPPPTVPGAQLVNQSGSSQSTSVLDSPTSCTGIFDQLWFCLCESGWESVYVRGVEIGKGRGVVGAVYLMCACGGH